MTDQRPEPAEKSADEKRPRGESPDPPRRNAPQGPLEDEHARSRKGHPSGNENFRGEP
jgi:hypothetical protein